MNSVNKPSNIIRFDNITHQIEHPTLLLETRSGEYIGQIKYTDLKLCFVGGGLDEISFNVHKTVNGIECPFWDRLQGLAIVNFKDYGRFEANFTTTDEAETIKACIAVSLETELGQLILRNFHVNDEDAIDSADNFKPTVLHDDSDRKHSLLHRVLSKKAPHWSIGEVSEYFNVGGRVYSPNTFQRTYTVDGTSIYDFLINDVSEETKCVFTFDTYNRKINCYNLEECVYNNSTLEVVEGAYKSNGLLYDANGNELNTTQYSYCEGIGNDTNIFITKNRLAQDFRIETNKDNIKNCFYVTGGDDIINNMGIPAANATGNNYIYLFDNFQYQDMSKQLRTKLVQYNKVLSSKQDEFYKENGLFLRYCSLQDDYHYLVHSMFPDTSLKTTTAAEQMNDIKNHFINNPVYIKYSCSTTSFAHVTGNVESMLNVLCDSRYNIKMLSGTDYPKSCTTINDETATGTWKGYIKITRETDEKDTVIGEITVRITLARDKDGYEYSDENIGYVNQKMQIAIARMSIADLDFSNMNNIQMKSLFEQYNLTTLNSFVEAFENCLVTLKNLYDNLGMTNETVSNSYTISYNTWLNRKSLCTEVQQMRQKQVDDVSGDLISIQEEIIAFNKSLDLQAYLNDDTLWKEFCSYVREDEYNNPNYTSDNLSDGEILQKSKELLNVATNELKKACVLQKTISGNMYNLFAVNELESLYDSFALYNYVRCEVDSKIYKLRLMQIDFDENSPEKINVTFSEQVESVDGKISDLKNIISQATSIATSYPATTNQAKQGLSAANTFNKLKNEGLTSAEYVIKNSVDEEIVIDSTGLNARSMNDVGVYGEHRLRLTGNGMYLTDNAWESVSMAVGLGKFKNDWRYGVWADCIVGNFIVGEKLEISDENGYVHITGDGIKIGGGSLYIANDEYSVEIDPNHQDTKTLEGYLFCIKKKSDNDIIMSVDTKGNGYFKGIIYATDGNFTGTIQSNDGVIGGWTIDTNSLYAEGFEVNGVKNKVELNSLNTMVQTSGYKGSVQLGGFLSPNELRFTDANSNYSVMYQGTFNNNIPALCCSGNFFADTIYSNNINTNGINSNNINATSLIFLNGKNITSGTVTVNGVQEPVIYNNGSTYIDGNLYVSGTGVIKQRGDDSHNITIDWEYDSDLIARVDNTHIGRIEYKGHNLNTHEFSRNPKNNFVTGEGDGNNIASVSYVDATFQTKSSSDFRLKRDITPLTNVKDLYLSLKPKQYKFKDANVENNEKYHTGLIAQEIQSNLENHGVDSDKFAIVEEYDTRSYMDEGQYARNGKALRVNYDNLHAYHIAFGQEIYKELKDENIELRNENRELKIEINELKQMIENLYILLP